MREGSKRSRGAGGAGDDDLRNLCLSGNMRLGTILLDMCRVSFYATTEHSKEPAEERGCMKKSTFIIACLVAGGLSVSLLIPSPASACDPAPPFRVEIVESDLPECLEVTLFGEPTSFHYWGAVVPFKSECEDPLEFVEVDCDDCLEDQVIEPDEETDLQLTGVAEGLVSEQTFAWTMAEESGTLRTSVMYRDTSGACDGWEESLHSSSGGCAQISGSGGGSGGELLFLVLLMVAIKARPTNCTLVVSSSGWGGEGVEVEVADYEKELESERPGRWGARVSRCALCAYERRSPLTRAKIRTLHASAVVDESPSLSTRAEASPWGRDSSDSKSTSARSASDEF